MNYLQRLPFNSIKIDRSFVNVLDRKLEGKRMVDSLITLAHNLNMCVIAEGVENTHQMELIRSLGGDEVQGYSSGAPPALQETIPKSHFDEHRDCLALASIPEAYLELPR